MADKIPGADDRHALPDEGSWCGDPQCCEPPELPLLERSVEDLAALIEQLDSDLAVSRAAGATAQNLALDNARRTSNLELGIALGMALGSGRVRLADSPNVHIERNGADIMGNGGLLRRVEGPEHIIVDITLEVDGAALEGLRVFMDEKL